MVDNFRFTKYYTLVILEQRKVNLANMEKVDDVDTTVAKLTEIVAKLNIERFHSVMELKVCFFSANHHYTLMATI
jgi:hypothetical protein